jgi:hypothetical protein
MVRTIITPDNATVSLAIPKSYIGKEVEILAFTKDEAVSGPLTDKKKTSFTVLHVDNAGYQFNRDEANER